MKKLIFLVLMLAASVGHAANLSWDDAGARIQGFAPTTTSSATATKHTVSTVGKLVTAYQCSADTKVRINTTTGAQWPVASSITETLVTGVGVTFLQFSSASGTTCYTRQH